MDDIEFLFPQIHSSETEDLGEQQLQQEQQKHLNLNKMMVINEILHCLSTYDNRGVFDFLSVVSFINDNLQDNQCLNSDFANLLKQEVLLLFLTSLWYPHSKNKDVFWTAFHSTMNTSYSFTKDDHAAFNSLVEELSSVFTNPDHIDDVTKAVNLIKTNIYNKILNNKGNHILDEYFNKIKLRIWVKKHIRYRLLYCNVCFKDRMKTILQLLPYKVVQNEHLLMNDNFEFDKGTFETVFQSFSTSNQINPYLSFLKQIGLPVSNVTYRMFLILFLPNYMVIWKRYMCTLNPRTIQKIKRYKDSTQLSIKDLYSLIIG